MWRIVELPSYPRGVYGIETNDRRAAENNEAILVYPCLTKANAELIVQAHNAAASQDTAGMAGAKDPS
jgi:hypothetical protein